MGDPLPNSDYLTVINDKSLASQIVHRLSLSTYFLTMNVHIKPFNNPLVREAVSYAFDRPVPPPDRQRAGVGCNRVHPARCPRLHQAEPRPRRRPRQGQGAPEAGRLPARIHDDPVQLEHPALDQPRPGDAAAARRHRHQGSMSTPCRRARSSRLAGTPNKAPMTITFWVADYPDGSDFFQALVSCAAGHPRRPELPLLLQPLRRRRGLGKGLADPANAGHDYVRRPRRCSPTTPSSRSTSGPPTEVFGAKVGGYFANPIWDLEMDFYWLKNGSTPARRAAGWVASSTAIRRRAASRASPRRRPRGHRRARLRRFPAPGGQR